MMNTQQLESFLEVAENLNFARAAENLNITQPAVSRQIHALEEELGTTLFHRSTKNVTLTSAGIIFLEEAKNMIASLHRATKKIQQHTDTNMQSLSIGCINEIDLILVSQILKRCKEKMPRLHPFLRTVSHKFILNLLFGDGIDILFAFKNSVPAKEGIAYKELFQAPVCCAFSSTHPFAHKKAVLENELYSQCMVVCNSYAIPPETMTLQTSVSRHIAPNSIYYCDNLNAMLTLVHSDYGFAIIPKIELPNSEICYVPFADKAPVSYGIFYKEPFQNSIVKKFISLI